MTIRYIIAGLCETAHLAGSRHIKAQKRANSTVEQDAADYVRYLFDMFPAQWQTIHQAHIHEIEAAYISGTMSEVQP